MTKKYHITIASGATKEELFPLVTSVHLYLHKRPDSFIANCTEEQVTALLESSLVDALELQDKEDISEEQAYSPRTVPYIRRQRLGSPTRAGLYGHKSAPFGGDAAKTPNLYYYDYNTADDRPPLGNWGLLRHTSPTNNLTTINTGGSATYTAPSYSGTALDGTGVDLILMIEGIIDIDDPEFQDSGVTRIQQFQWNSLPLRYAKDGSGYSAGDLILDGEGQTQYNTDANEVIYADQIEDTFTFGDAQVNVLANTIDIGTHSLSVGDMLVYFQGTGTEISNLSNDKIVYVRSINGNLITLKNSENSSLAIDLGIAGAGGSDYSLVKYTERVQVGYNDAATNEDRSEDFPKGIGDHGEAVAYIACSNTYGWATGAKIYIWPRNQQVKPGDVGTFDNVIESAWDSLRLFHQNKVANSDTRPTLVIDSIGARKERGMQLSSVATGISFRNNVYTEVSPNGAPDVSVMGYHQQDADNASIGGAYGNTNTVHSSGDVNFNIDPPLSDAERSTILSRLTSGYSEHSIYNSKYRPLEEMIDVGVHHVSSAGNYMTSNALPGGIDFNNGQFSNYGYDMDNLGYWDAFNRRNYYMAGDTIGVASLAPYFVSDKFNGKETMSDFSCRGEAVDCCAAGEGIFANLRANGEYAMSGTSFSSPQIAGMSCLVLQQYPTTTPRQLRRFWRDHAVGTTTLYDSGAQPIQGSKYGDGAYFSDHFGNRGYSGKIAYLDVNANNWTNPTTLSNDPITSSVTAVDNKLDFTIAQINSKLSSV